jgi:hypothetical protein
MKKMIEDDEVITIPTWVAMGVGLGVSHLRKSAGFKNHTESLAGYIDKDNDPCTVNLKYADVKESFSLTYLDVPIYLEIGRPNRIKISGFCKLGVKASILISNKVECKGTFTSEGVYEDPYYVTLHDVPPLGYYTNENCYLNPETHKMDYKLSPFVIWGSISGGVNIPFYSIEKKRLAQWILRVSAKVDYSLTPISKSLPDPYFTDAKFHLFQSNMLGGDGSKILSAGISIGLIYCL